MPKDEKKGIDGYIGNVPVSLKPITYKHKEMLAEKIDIDIIYYEKQKNGLKVSIPAELEGKLLKTP